MYLFHHNILLVLIGLVEYLFTCLFIWKCKLSIVLETIGLSIGLPYYRVMKMYLFHHNILLVLIGLVEENLSTPNCWGYC